jgi:DNA-binding transcriptional MerR regulator
MASSVTIGDFSRITYLSVEALRHYHGVGLLGPATRYRRYRSEQVPAAQVICGLRDLGMPLSDLRAVLKCRGRDQPEQGDQGSPAADGGSARPEPGDCVVTAWRCSSSARHRPWSGSGPVPSLRALAVSGNVAIADTEQWRRPARSSCRRNCVRHGVPDPVPHASRLVACSTGDRVPDGRRHCGRRRGCARAAAPP